LKHWNGCGAHVAAMVVHDVILVASILVAIVMHDVSGTEAIFGIDIYA
jgi:hypothetical protein